MKKTYVGLAAAAALVLMGSLVGCNNNSTGGGGSTGGAAEGEPVALQIDGSSTVYPIIEAMSEAYREAGHEDIDFQAAFSGTGGGFKKFNNKEIDIAMASRPIKKEELELAKQNGIEFIEVPIAFDGLTVVINPKNTFASTLTVEELHKIWAPDSKVKTWADVRAGFPAKEIKLYGPGTDSGTFDYFTDAINGKEGASRSTYTASEDDNTLVQGVSGDEFALGYFGYAYYKENKDKLTAVKVDPGTGGVAPDEETILSGSYQPLSRPLFIYINKKSLEEKPAIKNFLEFLFNEGQETIMEVGYVHLTKEINDQAMKHVEEGLTGTRFMGAKVGMKITDVMSKDGTH